MTRKDLDLIIENIDPTVHANQNLGAHTAEYYNYFQAVEMQTKNRPVSHRDIRSKFRRYKSRTKKIER